MSDLNVFVVMEAVASVSLSHDEDCRCLTCRAALDEPGAMAELLATLAEREIAEHMRPGGPVPERERNG